MVCHKDPSTPTGVKTVSKHTAWRDAKFPEGIPQFPKDIWYGGCQISLRIFGMGVPKYRGVEVPMTLGMAGDILLAT